jgi:CheY-like chemotaxis protein
MYVTMKLDDMFNYTTHLFPSAEEALNNIHLKPDILVMDYVLPGINGLEAMKKVKEMSPDTAIVLMSAQNDTETTSAILNAGAHSHIQKDKLAAQKIIDAIVEITGSKK